MLRHLHIRLLVLLSVVVIAAIAATLGALGLATRMSNVERASRTLHAQVVAADALLAMPDRDAAIVELRKLGIEWRAEPPPGERSSMPLLVQTEARIGARLPKRPMRMAGIPATLWVRERPPQQGWIGIRVLGEPEPFRRGVILSLIAIGALVLSAAALFARTLTRPLRSLAAAAPAIVAGDPPPTQRFASAEILELQASLAAAAERTRAAARDRELMLAGLSHDMRTPLARLRYGLALAERDLDEDARAAMERDIDEIDTIVGQFIDYVRDGRDEAEAHIDLAAAVRAQAERQAHLGGVWTLDLPDEAPLRGRPLALQRAIANLFDNAMKHGAAPFEASLERTSEDGLGEGWRLCVRDRGPGVTPERLDELGRPFYRADDARRTPGSGLGLASVARVAAVHRGSLRLRNRDGGGLEAQLRLREPSD